MEIHVSNKRSFDCIFIVIVIVIVCALSMCSCATSRTTTQLVKDIRVDTLYLSNQHYDSIYIYQDKLIDRSRDTLYIKDKSIEYRYNLVRDTIVKSQIDSIPYEVTVIETKEITRPLTLFDKLCRLCFYVLLGVLLFWIYAKTRKIYDIIRG